MKSGITLSRAEQIGQDCERLVEQERKKGHLTLWQPAFTHWPFVNFHIFETTNWRKANKFFLCRQFKGRIAIAILLWGLQACSISTFESTSSHAGNIKEGSFDTLAGFCIHFSIYQLLGSSGCTRSKVFLVIFSEFTFNHFQHQRHDWSYCLLLWCQCEIYPGGIRWSALWC